jgi:hypothetical protein
MFRPSLRRIAVLALCVLLAGSGALSAKPRATVLPDSVAVSKGARAVGLWDTVRSFLISVWTKNGSASDPFGNPTSTQGSQPEVDNGCSGDPYGHCLPGH